MEKETKKELNLESKRLMELSGIKERDKKYLINESFSEVTQEENKKDDEFIVLEFEQEEVEPGPEDEQLYKLH